MSNPIRVAHCGLGHWGPNLLRNLAQNPACRVTALCDISRPLLEKFGAAHPDAALVDSVEEVSRREDVDAVVLATPAGLHEEHVRLMIEAGKDVLVEKPLALTLATAEDLVELAAARGRLLMVGHTFLFNPAVRRAREEIASGNLGDLRLVLAQRLSLGRIREDCNALWNLAPHDVSILLHWLDAMPLNVSTRGIALHEGHKQEDIAFVTMEFPGRIMASVQVSWINPVKVRAMTVVGSRKMLVYDDVDADQPLTVYNKRVEEVADTVEPGTLERFRLEIRQGPEEALPVDWREPLAEEIAHFLHCIRTRETPIGSGTEALGIMSVLEACALSLKQGGLPVEPRAPRSAPGRTTPHSR